MRFPNGLGGGWDQSAGNRGFRVIESVCKSGPNFDSCSCEQLIGTGRVVFAVALFVSISGFVVWFVVTDQLFALGDKIRSLRFHQRRRVDLNFCCLQICADCVVRSLDGYLPHGGK
jgi:hypothetical protein